jgi:protein-tyrosine phosphatase
VINLRSKAEADKIPEPFGPEDGVDCYTIPLIPDAAINESIRSGPFKELYIRFAEHGIKKIGRVFSIMAQCHGTCLFHCYAGKDRTGIIAALLLLAMGVDRNDAIADYEVSGTYYRRKIDDYSENDYDKSKAENIEHLLEYIDKKYGNAEGYLRAAGVGDADFEALRRKFLADPAI